MMQPIDLASGVIFAVCYALGKFIYDLLKKYYESQEGKK